MDFIELTTSDSGDPFLVRPEAISALYRQKGKDYTVVHYSQNMGSGTWAVRETPDEILARIKNA